MNDQQKKFIEFLISVNALKFGDFILKSGRQSPYFLNMGAFYSGKTLSEIGKYYADAIVNTIKKDFTVIFGPAYKGIPLALATVQALYVHHGINANYAFNRKEAKDHGEGGMIVGKMLESTDKIIVVDDVITAGTAIRETIDVISYNSGAIVQAIVIAVDRMEKGKGSKSALDEMREMYGIPIIPIVTIIDILEFLKEKNNNSDYGILISKMEKYLREYGASYQQ